MTILVSISNLIHYTTRGWNSDCIKYSWFYHKNINIFGTKKQKNSRFWKKIRNMAKIAKIPKLLGFSVSESMWNNFQSCFENRGGGRLPPCPDWLSFSKILLVLIKVRNRIYEIRKIKFCNFFLLEFTLKT